MGFPVVLNPAVPDNSENPSLGASRIRAIIQALVDLFNLPANTNISAALAITRVGPYTNSTGVTLSAGDVVALNAGADASVVLSDTQGSLNQFVVALATITNAATGVFGQVGQVTITTQGAVTRGHYLRKSATTKAVEDAGVAVGATLNAPAGAVGVALTAAAGPGAGTCVAQLFGATARTIATGSYEVRGHRSVNNAVAPTTKIDCSADSVALRNPTDGSIVVRTATGTLTNDTGAAQVADGRDQAGAFTASTFIHLYYIWNGTTLATLTSATGPPTGPTLPTGYTHWAYAETRRVNAVPALETMTARGAIVFWDAEQSVLANGTAAIETSVDLAAKVPAAATRALLRAELICPRNATVSDDDTLRLRYATGANFDSVRQTRDNFGTGNLTQQKLVLLPNVGQAVLYLLELLSSGGTGSSASLFVVGYTVPNGDS